MLTRATRRIGVLINMTTARGPITPVFMIQPTRRQQYKTRKRPKPINDGAGSHGRLVHQSSVFRTFTARLIRVYCYNLVMDSTTPTNKLLGQHWLHDAASLKLIVDAAEVSPSDTVLEIGPGTGTLTRALLERAGQVVAVEKDCNLARKLQTELQDSRLRVVAGDILTYDTRQLPEGYKIVANIPYYLTSHLIKNLSASPNPPLTAVLLVQKEVAERANAKPGAASLLSVSTQYHWEVRPGAVIPARLFMPPPKVDSQILILKRRFKPLFPDVDPKLFFRLVKAGFSERRKKLKSSLSGGLRLGKPAVIQLLQSANIDPDLRAQELSLDQWYDLYRQYTLSLSRSPLP